MATLITPETLAASGTELGTQRAVVMWSMLPETLALYPELEWLHAIPNGGERSKSSAANAKSEGVKSGVYDLFLPAMRGGYGGLYIEMKRPDLPGRRHATTSDKQDAFGLYASKAGYGVIVCWTWTDARDAIISYLNYRG